MTLDSRTGGGYGYTYIAAGRLSEFRINGVLQASYRYAAAAAGRRHADLVLGGADLLGLRYHKNNRRDWLDKPGSK